MLLSKRKKQNDEPASFSAIMMLSAWGLVLAIASFLFLWVGHFLDEILGTAPVFMLGLFFTAIIGCFIELFDEARRIVKANRGDS